MELCSCGETTDVAGAKCARCSALQTLGLESSATFGEIKSAYKLLVKVWHPDRFSGDEKLRGTAQEKLQAINQAYRFLSSNQPGRGRSRVQAYRSSSSDQPGRSRRPWAQALVISAFLLGLLWLLGWFFVQPLDTMVSSNPMVGPMYREYKVRVIGRWQTMLDSLPGLLGRHRNEPQSEVAHDPPAAEAGGNEARSTAREPAASKPAGRKPGAAPGSPAKIRVLPYITAGSTRGEVIETLGTPTSETEDKLIYGYSELDFSNGSLVGWRIDPARSPLRVKLWPSPRVDPDLDAFWIGSTKSEVIAVEGTPTFLSEDTFGYGKSEVYFQNGRVVNWKNDPSSTFLRTRSR